MHRRSFVKNSAFTAVGAAFLNPFNVNTVELVVNGQRIVDRIMELSVFGKDANGHGYRVAYSKGDVEGRQWMAELMRKAKLDVTIDAAGNIIGKRAGKIPSLKPIAFGSHIDMVPDGGNYDGPVGSISGLEIIEVLNEHNTETNHPLELIIFANEEGGTVGSKALVGTLTTESLDKITQSGLSIRDGIKAIGGDPEKLDSCRKNKDDYHAFLELHIEQGGILEQENMQIGIVEGIVGMKDWNITIEGFANHAGATPMNMRQDALLSASKLVVAVNQVITAIPGKHVATVGKISALPGASNVIPGKASISLEIRDLSLQKIDMLFGVIKRQADMIAKEHKTTFSYAQDFELNPALADEKLKQVIGDTAKKLNLTTKLMPSGAYHDSAHMSTIAPMAMIFIPSVGGISHSPKEFSKPEDIANGANMLLQTLLAIDNT